MQITAETVNITVAQPASDLSLIQEWLDKKDNTRLTGCAKLTYAARFDLEEDLKTSCYTRRELARKYGISSTRVSQIATYIGSPPARSRGRRYNPGPPIWNTAAIELSPPACGPGAWLSSLAMTGRG